MRMQRIANNVALQTLGYIIRGDYHVNIYVLKNEYLRREIYRGQYLHFDEMRMYGNCRVKEIFAADNVLYIGIEV